MCVSVQSYKEMNWNDLIEKITSQVRIGDTALTGPGTYRSANPLCGKQGDLLYLGYYKSY